MGIVTKTFHDDLGRQTHVAENWDNFTPGSGGSGTGPDDKDRVTAFAYNGLGQISLQSALDANGDGNRSDDQNTRYLYEDPYNASLVTNIIYPDSTDSDSSGSDQVKLVYNLDGSIASRTDQNGTTIAFTYTSRRQLEYQSVTTVGSGVDDHIRSIGHSYDELARVEKVTSYENTSGGGDVRNEIVWQYNDLGQVTTTWQSHDGAAVTSGGGESPKVQYAYDLSASSSIYNDGGRLDSVTYPSGRAVRYGYGGQSASADRLHRINAINDESSNQLVLYRYNGTRRLVLAQYTQATVRLNHHRFDDDGEYEGYDRFGRVRDQFWGGYSGTADVDRFWYGYDFAGNRLFRNVDSNILASGKDQAYSYDNLHRLTKMGHGNWTGSSLNNIDFEQEWTLDQLGNWGNFVEKTSGGTTLDQDRAHNLANEITNITTNTGSSWIIPAHDAAGNMTSAPSANDPTKRHWYVYDAWNRLVAVWEDDGDSTKEITGGSPDDTLIARYEYDGQNRRIAKQVYTGGSLDHTLDMYYNENWQILEVRKDGNANPLKQYVWHTYYINAPAIRYYDADTDGAGVETQYFTHDANFNVTALVDDTGSVIERYDYTPYGQVTILDPDFSVKAESDFGQNILFQGLYLDTETGCIQNRHRMWMPHIGRFAQRDPIGYPDGMNGYCGYHILYSTVDPLGLTRWRWRIRDLILGTNTQLLHDTQVATAARARSVGREDVAQLAEETFDEFDRNVEAIARGAAWENMRTDGACLFRCIADATLNIVNPIPGLTVRPYQAGYGDGNLFEWSGSPLDWSPGAVWAVGIGAEYAAGQTAWILETPGEIPSGGPNPFKVTEVSSPSDKWIKRGKVARVAGKVLAVPLHLKAIHDCYCKCNVYKSIGQL